MAATDHPCFIAPGDKDIKIWRYMDFTKFVSLLETQCLYLSRADKFEDPFEGSLPVVNAAFRSHHFSSAGFTAAILEKIAAESSLFTGAMRRWTYINCWHMNKHESAAMWKLYAKSDEAVAIQSTYSKLHDALPNGSFLGTVTYLDYNTAPIPDGNSFWPYVHKRLSFEHEKELRIVEQEFPANENGLDVHRENKRFGKTVHVELSRLIESVYVSPTSPEWFYHLVESIAKRYGFSFPTRRSDIMQTPVF